MVGKAANPLFSNLFFLFFGCCVCSLFFFCFFGFFGLGSPLHKKRVAVVMSLASKVGARLLTTTTGGGAQRYYRAFQCSHHLRPAKMTTTHQQIRGCALAAVRSSTRTTTAYDSHSSWKKKNNDQLPRRPTKRECRTEIRTASSSSSSSAVAAAARVKEVAILGSGAAGLTAAYFAAVTQKDAKTVLRVTVYEKTKESGRKF